MNHADIKGLNLMEGGDFEHLLYNKACDGNNVSGIQGAQTVWQADIKTLRTKNF